jgi:hypothetical protein
VHAFPVPPAVKTSSPFHRASSTYQESLRAQE